MTRLNKGVLLALITAGFSGVAIFLNSLTVKAVGDALVFTTVKNLGVGVIILGILGIKTSKREIDWKGIKTKDWLKLAGVGVIGGSVPFYLFFKGLMMASSAQAALLHKTLVLWIALAAGKWLKERLSWKQIAAVVGIFGSNFLIGGIPQLSWGAGEMMILGATVLWAVENIIAKKVLNKVQVDVVVGARMILGSVILLVATLGSGKLGLIMSLSTAQWGMTLVSVVMLFGYVMSWYRALKLAPATMVASVLSLGTIVTNVLSGIFVTRALNIGFIYQSILLVIFLVIFVKNQINSERFINHAFESNR